MEEKTMEQHHIDKLQQVVAEQQGRLGQQVYWLQEQKTALQTQMRENTTLKLERQRLVAEVEQLRVQMTEKDKEIAKMVAELKSCKELGTRLREDARQKDSVISEMQSTILSLEGSIRRSQQQKKSSFLRLSMPKLTLSRSSSSPEVYNDGEASPAAGKQRISLKRRGSYSKDTASSPTPLSPLLELSTPQEVSSDHLLDQNNDDGGLESPSMCIGNISELPEGNASTNGNVSHSHSSGDSNSSHLSIASSFDISDIRWKEGKKAPEKMARGSSTVHGNAAYFRPAGSNKVHMCSIVSGKLQWSSFPDNKYQNFSLAVIENHLTSLGGQALTGDYGNTNSVLSISLSGGRRKQWVQMFPPMLTARCNATSIVSGQTVIVVGGYDRGYELDTVEVLRVNTRQWNTVTTCLPQRLSNLVGAVFNGSLYLAGGFKGGQASQCVFSCSLSHILKSQYSPSDSSIVDKEAEEIDEENDDWNPKSVWQRVCDLPVGNSTIETFSDNLLAIGGLDETKMPTSTVYRYDPESNTWDEVCVMKNKRERCFVATVTSKMIIVGGVSKTGAKTDHVEIADIPSF